MKVSQINFCIPKLSELIRLAISYVRCISVDNSMVVLFLFDKFINISQQTMNILSMQPCGAIFAWKHTAIYYAEITLLLNIRLFKAGNVPKISDSNPIALTTDPQEAQAK